MITARVAAEDRLPNRGCAGGVTLLVTGSHSCHFFLHHEEFEFLFLVDVLYGVPRVWCSEVELPEILVVEKSQSLLILKVFNYYVRRTQLQLLFRRPVCQGASTIDRHHLRHSADRGFFPRDRIVVVLQAS
jgi:hypothetical protein